MIHCLSLLHWHRLVIKHCFYWDLFVRNNYLMLVICSQVEIFPQKMLLMMKPNLKNLKIKCILSECLLQFVSRQLHLLIALREFNTAWRIWPLVSMSMLPHLLLHGKNLKLFKMKWDILLINLKMKIWVQNLIHPC